MNQSPDIKRTTGNYVTFEFPQGIDATITIQIHEVHTREGQVKTHIIYDSKEDKEYRNLVGLMTRAAGSIMENNFADGKDETATPVDLSDRLEQLKSLVRAFDKEKGHQVTFRLLGGAKAELFNKESRIRERTIGEKQTLEEILRWHIEQALNTQEMHPSLV
jgi:hypothetical protein